MILGVDASNVRAGGGLTHLRELLAAAEPESHGFERVVVWGGRKTLDALSRRPWLALHHIAALDRPLPVRLAWQHVDLPIRARLSCDVLFSPGGLALTPFRPRVLVSQNMLPFELEERARYGRSRARLRFELLARGQAASFGSADGVIFLSEYARRVVSERLGRIPRRTAVIPHGIDARFRRLPRAPRADGQPLQVLYVSTVSPYKHQWNVVDAVGILRREGLPISLRLVGGSDFAPAVEQMRAAIARVDPAGLAVRYEGILPFEALHEAYHQADLFVFASTCENLPNILIEAMASGLPIACSNRGPMPEVLGEAGVYFDPESSESIAQSLRRLVNEAQLRSRLAHAAFERAQSYSWAKCARETLSFIAAARRGDDV